MRRIASHYIYWRKWYRMHYLELDAKGRLTGVYPLVQEIANTEFYDGTLLPVPSDITFPPVGVSSLAEWLAVTDSVTIDSLVQVCHLPRISRRRLNSAQTTAVAIATFSDSDVSLSCG